jgi:hypothetical protein
MVELEWQNAIMKATQGQTKLIPIKLDDCLMPAILLQSLYIDLFGQGLEVALRQIVDITSGRNTFQPGPQTFSNLRAYKSIENQNIIIECHAEHYLEPISNYLFLTNNTANEIKYTCTSENMCNTAFHTGLTLSDGIIYNAIFIGTTRATVPGFPFTARISPVEKEPIDIVRIMHEDKKDFWKMIPLIDGKKSRNVR